MFSHDNGRKDFIAYATARYITHLANASPSDYGNAVAIALALASRLELSGVAPWPPSTWDPKVLEQIRAAQLAAAQAANPQPLPSAPPGLVPIAPPQGQSSAAADNTAKLLANLPPGVVPAPQGPPAQTGAVVGDTGAPKAGTHQNPVTSGQVVAANGEVQGHREQVIGPTITNPQIVSDVQAVRQPGVVPGTPGAQ